MLQSDCFKKQLLLHRYAELIRQIGKLYNLSDERIQALQNHILTIDWL